MATIYLATGPTYSERNGYGATQWSDPIFNINFDYYDHIHSTINLKLADLTINAPNYIKVADTGISTQWYVLDIKYLAAKQFIQLTLLRDVVYDYKNEYLGQMMHYSRYYGEVQDYKYLSPVNLASVIRKRTDITAGNTCNWYYAFIQGSPTDIPLDAGGTTDYRFDLSTVPNTYSYQYPFVFNWLVNTNPNLVRPYKFNITLTSTEVTGPYGGVGMDIPRCYYSNSDVSSITPTYQELITKFRLVNQQTTDWSYLNNKTVYDTSSGNTYRITINYLNTQTLDYNIVPAQFAQGLSDITNKQIGTYTMQATDRNVSYDVANYTITKTLIAQTTDLLQISQAPNHTVHNKSYSILAWPNGNANKHNQGINASLLTSMCNTLGTGANNIFDIQLLPYGPELNKAVSFESQNSNFVGFWLLSDIHEYTMDIPRTNDYEDILRSSLYSSFSIVAHNRSSVFKFDATAYTSESYITLKIIMSVMPYSTNISILPKLGGLYITSLEYDLSIGCTYTSINSIQMTASEWQTYVHNNFNYAAQFESAITYQSDKFSEQYKYTELASGIALATSGINNITSGAISGAAAGGAPGAIAGGALGVLSIGAGAVGRSIDLAHISSQYNLDRNQQIDQHELQLQAIQARPTIVRPTSINHIYNTWPQLIEYSTPASHFLDSELIATKIGYKVDCADYIRSNTYVQGKLINPVISASTSIVQQLQYEFEQGIWI